MNCTTDAVAIIPEDTQVRREELELHIDGIAEGWVCLPDSELFGSEWDEEFRRFDDYCWECWGQIRDAVSAVVGVRGSLCSISPCFQINEHMVAIAVTYSRKEYEQYPHMDMDVFAVHGRWPALHFGVVEAVLNEFGEELRKWDAGRRHIETVERDRLLRGTAEFFTRCNVWANKRFSRLDVQLRGTLDFYDACNVISSMPYESRQGSGGMLIADAGHAAIDVAMETELPVLANNHRRVRKLVEMCHGGLAVLTDSRYVWGLGRFVEDRYDSSRADVLHVRFLGQGRWVLSHLGTDLMVVQGGYPKLPRPKIDRDALMGKVVSLFGEIASGDVIIDLVECGSNARHGAVMVVSQDAVGESKRLSGGRVGFKPFEATKETMVASTSIDGAVMLDLEGNCHGVGLILDGEAGPKEELGRGARFNSVLRYLRRCSDREIRCLIVAISEDGMVDSFSSEDI